MWCKMKKEQSPGTRSVCPPHWLPAQLKSKEAELAALQRRLDGRASQQLQQAAALEDAEQRAVAAQQSARDMQAVAETARNEATALQARAAREARWHPVEGQPE